jgi:hypothetical protein
MRSQPPHGQPPTQTEGKLQMKALFREVSYRLSKLLAEVEDGEIGLPEIQRPFVWSRAKVRDLFDSMYRGFPVGYLLFWENPSIRSTRQIGIDEKQHVPRRLIVDGQQRLTSLYSVMQGRPVVDDQYRETHLLIAFRPRDGRFAVPDAATERDPEYIRNISELWSGDLSRHRFQTGFIERLNLSRRLSPDEEDHIVEAIDRLYDLREYPFTALELASSADENQVADIFVRINSQGVELKQADFILTLMSVHWDKGRRELEDFSRATRIPAVGSRSPFNHFIQPSPDDMLRVTIGLGLRRAQLRAVYAALRGKEIDTGKVSLEARDAQFALMQEAQQQVLDLTNWNEFLKALQQAGYRSSSMITSEFNVLFSYVTFLIGRCDHAIDYPRLRSVMARWFVMCALTGRYTGTSESRMEQDLRRLGEAENADEFMTVLDSVIATQLTNDFFDVALPDLLETSSGYSPMLFAYYAALNVLGAKVLFSSLTVSELLDPNLNPTRAPLDRHHLFNRKYLALLGIKGTTRVNQLANYVLLEWPDDVEISSDVPAAYFPQLWDAFVPPAEQDQTRFLHALPEGWEEMSYEEFLGKRRMLIAKVIKAAFGQLKDGSVNMPGGVPTLPGRKRPSVAELISGDESSEVEFKSSAAASLENPDIPEKMINEQVIKTVAAFLNTDGGTLAIGIADDRVVLGIENDLDLKSTDLDRYINWLTTLLITSCGIGPITACTRIRWETIDGKTVVLVDVNPSPKPVYVKSSKSVEVFYVRANNTTRQLPLSEIHDWVTARWKS